MKQERIILILGFGFLLFPLFLTGAQEVRLRVSSGEAFLGQPLTLSLQIMGDQEPKRPNFPALEGFELSPAGEFRQSSRVFSGGRTQSTVVTEYRWKLTPLKAGQFTIPSLEIPLGDRTVQTEPLTLWIKTPEAIEGYELLLESSSSRGVVQLPLDLTLILLFSRDVAELEFLFPFLKEGHPVEDLPPLSQMGKKTYQLTVEGRTVYAYQDRQEYQGQSYSSLTLSWRIYPKEEGTLAIGPAYGSFQVAGASQSLVIPSNTLILPVESLPEEVAQFPGGILVARGDLEVEASLSQIRFYPGDPISLTLVFKGLNNPELTQFQGVQGFPGLQGLVRPNQGSLEGTAQEDRKIYSQKLRFIREGRQTFPPLEFPYYSLEKGAVQRASTQAIEVELLALEEREDQILEEGEKPPREDPASPALPRPGKPATLPAPWQFLFSLRYPLILFLVSLTLLLLFPLPRREKKPHGRLLPLLKAYGQNPVPPRAAALYTPLQAWLGLDPPVRLSPSLQKELEVFLEVLDTFLWAGGTTLPPLPEGLFKEIKQDLRRRKK